MKPNIDLHTSETTLMSYLWNGVLNNDCKKKFIQKQIPYDESHLKEALKVKALFCMENWDVEDYRDFLEREERRHN